MKSNRISPRLIEQALGSLPSHNGPIPANERKEYNELLQEISSDLPEPELPPAMAPVFTPPQPGDHGALILGAAGQRVVTAGELLCLAGMSAGLQVSQNNDVPITVLTGHSVSEVILSPEGIDDPGLSRPSVVLVLADEGVARRRSAFASLDDSCLVLRASPALDLPETRAEIIDLNLEDLGLKRTDWALGTLAALAWRELILTREMLEQAIAVRLPDRIAESSCRVVEMVCQKGW